MKFEKNLVRVGSGVPLAALVVECARKNLKNMEIFAGIPGTVGGAVVGNANEIGEAVSRVKILENGKVKIFEKKDLKFSYRDSNLRGKILTEIEFILEKTDDDLQRKVAELAHEKFAKHPFEKTAGSWFRNPKGELAWKLIDAAGCRGLKIGDAVVSEKHANFFQNAGKATAVDFLELEKMVAEKVFKKFSVRLEREVIVVPEN